jgi:seryl-tRNA synthetase
MLDIRIIREKPDFVAERLATRGETSAKEMVSKILAFDEQRRHAETEAQRLKTERNRASKELGARKSKGEDITAASADVRAIGDRITALDAQAAALDVEQRDALLATPNLPHPGCPIGRTAEDNPVVRVWGEPPAFGFKPKSHIELGESLGLLDFERAAKISGSAFTVYTGVGARLERALINFLLDLHTREHGYTEVGVPLLVKADALIGTTQLPKFAEQQYRCADDDLYLVPTAEVPVTNLHREELLPLAQLPIKYAAYTPCFRREAGAAGVGTRGLIRMHQFDKVELVKICTPETSYAEHDALTADAEKVLQLLGFPYRTIELCTGDLGFGATKTYDVEVWAPGQNGYLEVSSCTNFEDYQARRMNLRYKDTEGKNRFCHTLNGSGTALARLYVALLENGQREDGSVAIPEALQSYFGAAEIRK